MATIEDRVIEVKIEGFKPFLVRATYSEKEWAWAAIVTAEDEGVERQAISGLILGSDPYDCIGRAVEALVRDADRGEVGT